MWVVMVVVGGDWWLWMVIGGCGWWRVVVAAIHDVRWKSFVTVPSLTHLLSHSPTLLLLTHSVTKM